MFKSNKFPLKSEANKLNELKGMIITPAIMKKAYDA